MTEAPVTATLPSLFDAAYLINLPSRTDRLHEAQREFGRVGWTLGAGGVEVFPACSFDDAAGFPGIGVRGCFQSHLECLKRAARAGSSAVLVLEDDIALSAAIPVLTPLLIERLSSAQWDFLYFGYEGTGPTPIADDQSDRIELIPFRGDLLTTHFYAVRGAILPALIDHLELTASGRAADRGLVRMPVDGAYNVFRALHHDMRTLLVAPKLGWQRPSRSDITPKRMDNIRALRPLLSLLRGAKHAISR